MMPGLGASGREFSLRSVAATKLAAMRRAQATKHTFNDHEHDDYKQYEDVHNKHQHERNMLEMSAKPAASGEARAMLTTNASTLSHLLNRFAP